MSDSSPDDVELLLEEAGFLLASPSLELGTVFFPAIRAGFGLIKTDAECGTRSARRVDSKGLVR